MDEDPAQMKGKEPLFLRKLNAELGFPIRFNPCYNPCNTALGESCNNLFKRDWLSVTPTKILSQGQLPLRISFHRLTSGCKPSFDFAVSKGSRGFLNPDLSGGCLDEVGHLLHRAWQLKRSLCDSISNPMLDTIYERAVTAGALGGKILGAGGGGYFLFYVPKEKQGAVTATLSDLGLSQQTFHFEPKGSQIIEGRNLDESHYPYRQEQDTTQSIHLRSSLRH